MMKAMLVMMLKELAGLAACCYSTVQCTVIGMLASSSIGY